MTKKYIITALFFIALGFGICFSTYKITFRQEIQKIEMNTDKIIDYDIDTIAQRRDGFVVVYTKIN